MQSTTVVHESTTIVVMNTIGARLRSIREAAGESQLDAAKAAGVQKQAISKIERDATSEPSARTMYRLAQHYGVDIGWLLGFSENISSKSETMRLEPSNVSNTVGAMERHYRRHERSLDLKNEEDATRFVQLYFAIAELPTERTDDNLIELGSKLEAIAPLTHGGEDGRKNSLPTGRQGGPALAGGRAGKKA